MKTTEELKAEALQSAIKKIEKIFLNKMIELGFDADTAVRVTETEVVIGKSLNGFLLFGSEVTFYPDRVSLSWKPIPAQMNYGVTGPFTPNDLYSTAETYRTTSAGIAVANWNQVANLVFNATRKIQELMCN